MLRIRVLGSLGAEVRGEPVALGASRQRTVLSLLLAARGAVVPAERLTDELWRGTPPAKAKASLHAYVSNLRRLLEPDRPPRAPSSILLTTPPGYALRLPEEAVDAWRFEAWVSRARDAPVEEARRLLAEALEWWKGPAFAEHATELWALAEVARLTELRAGAHELAVATDLRAGRASEAALAAEALTGERPLREEGWRLLALAQWECGRQADALSSLRRAGAVLREELGCDPGPALRELEQAVLAQRVDLLHSFIHGQASRNTAPTYADPGSPEPAPAEHMRGRQRLFVGRRGELAAVDAAAHAARTGGATVLVTGEAGAGKTALLEQIGRRLRAGGWRVVVGRCPEYEGAPPAWAWVEALGELARQVPPTRPDELEVLLREPAHTAVKDRDAAAAGRFRMHRAFTQWLQAVAADSPLAVIMEDLHRADSETLALLEVAATEGVPLLLIASYRPAEPGEHLTKTLAALALTGPCRVSLGGLPQDDVATVVGAVCGGPVDADTVRALAERTGGNPFYVLESARLMASEGALVAVSEVPQGVRDVLRRRLALLPAEARSSLQLAAAVGLEADVTLLAAADADEERILKGLDAALSADLLTEVRPGRVRFVHALVRDTVYTDLPGVRRARLHARIARVLCEHRPDDFAALAHHFARSGDLADAPMAIDYALRAAEAAEQRYAHDSAVELIQQAIDVHTSAAGETHGQPDRTVGLLVRLLGAQIRAGSTEAALHTRNQAVRLAEQADRGDLAAAVYGAWTEPSPWRSRLEAFYDRTSLPRLEQLAGDPGLDDATRARVLQVLVDVVATEDAQRALDAARTQLAIARAHGEPRLLAAALMTSAKLLPHEVHAAARPALVAELRQLVDAHDLPAYRWVCEHLDGMSAATDNDPAAVRRHVAEGMRIARRYGLQWAQGLNTVTSAMLEAAAGRFDAAEADYAKAQSVLQRVGTHHAASMVTLGRITVRLAQGRLAEAERAMRDAYESVGAPVGAALAVILARLGRLDEAGEVTLPPKITTDHLYGMELDFRAQLVTLRGDVDGADVLIEHLLPVRHQLGAVAGGAYVTRPLAQALGDLYRLVGEYQAAAENYALAERTALAWNSPHLVADARQALASLDRDRERRVRILS
ncbi:BTAD domain-containing putative transcriptional regulator [Streptomyces sp. NPDC048324]|uniref:BTAD domain-containing putative transcriptional regulator n=1 Tax=Streptomyces sp. NPDC048324 TaxID=3157205 RepID=UPI0034434679